jgi:multiple sugar transport system permease protein
MNRAHTTSEIRRKTSDVRRFVSSTEPYLYLLPTIIGLLLFSAGSVVATFFISFTRWPIVTSPHWIGLGNYRAILQSHLFWQVFWNTLYFAALAVPLSVGAALAAAVLVHRQVRGIRFFRTVYFLPVVSSMVAVALVWSYMFNPEYGVLNYLLKLIGIRGPAWLYDAHWAIPAMVLVTVWKGMGYSMVIFLAGLQSIPEELYEAAALDGAGSSRRFWRITLPMLSPTLFFVLVITLINSFQVFEQTYVLTRGGPANATLTLSYHIYENAFQFFQMGYAAAESYVLFAFVFAITLVQFKLQHRWVFYG